MLIVYLLCVHNAVGILVCVGGTKRATLPYLSLI